MIPSINDTQQISNILPQGAFQDETIPSVTIPTGAFSEPNKPILPPVVVADKAAKTDYAMGEDSPGQDKLTEALNSGLEPTIRNQMAAKEDSDFVTKKLQTLSAIGSKPYEQWTPQEIGTVINYGLRAKQDPSSVLETVFARRLITDLVNQHTPNVRKLAEESATDFVGIVNGTQGVVARQQQLNNLYTELKAEHDKTPWLSFDSEKPDKVTNWVFDNVVPFWSWYFKVNNLPTDVSALKPGENIADQVKNYWLATDAELPALNKKIRDLYKRDPMMGLQLMESLIQFSNNDALFNNIVEWANLVPGLTPRKPGKLSFEIGATPPKEIYPNAYSSPIGPPPNTAYNRELKPGIKVTYNKLGEKEIPKELKPFAEGVDSTAYTKQGELAVTTDQSLQRGLFGELPEQSPPLQESKLPPGKLRATSPPRRFETYQGVEEVPPWVGPNEPYQYQLGFGNYAPMERGASGKFLPRKRQLELNLPAGESQAELPLEGGKPTPKPAVPPRRDQVIQEFKDYVNSVSTEVLDPEYMASYIGNAKAAAEVAAAKDLHFRDMSLHNDPEVKPLSLLAQHFWNPGKWAEGSSMLGKEAANRIVEGSMRLRDDLINATTNDYRVIRKTPEAYRADVARSAEFYQKAYGKDVRDAINNVTVIPPDKSRTNAGRLDFWFGKTDATGFATAEDANRFMKDIYKIKDAYTIEQTGGAYFGIVSKPVRENFEDALNVMINAEAAKTPKVGLIGQLFNIKSKLATADSLTSALNTLNRKVSLMGGANMRGVLNDALDDIRSIGKVEMKELERVFDYEKVFPDPVSGLPGKYSNTYDEFARTFFEVHGKTPTDAQAAMYHRSIILNNFQGFLQDMDWIRDLRIQGGEMFKVHNPDKGASEWFPGRKVKDIDWNQNVDSLVVVLDKTDGQEYAFHTKDGATKTKEFKDLYQPRIDNGELQIIEVANTRARPVKDVLNTEGVVHYIITNTAQTRPLAAGDIAPWRDGMHLTYTPPKYIKQPTVVTGFKGKSYYTGDKTLIGVDPSVDGALLEKQFNEAQLLLHNKKDAELEVYLQHSIIPLDAKEFKKLYTGAGPGGGLQSDVPMVLVDSGRDALSTKPDLYKAWPDIKTRDVGDIDMYSKLDRKYIGERGQVLNSLFKVGTEQNPLYELRQSEMLHSFDTLTRSIGNALRGRYIGDYKTMAATHWVEEFGSLYANKVPIERLRANPVYYMNHPPEFNPGVDRAEANLAESTRIRSLNFMGAQDDLGKNIAHIQHKLLEKMGNKADPETWGGYFRTGMVEAIRDPAAFLRASAFHITQINPAAFFTQLQTFVISDAILPQYSVRSQFGGLIQMSILRNESPEVLAAAAKKARFFGWKPEEFIEATLEGKKSGWFEVGGETVWKNHFDVPMFQSKMGKVLDAGGVFFNEGERSVRINSWNLAYLEWKKQNPGKAITAFDRAKILDRADDLGQNMTRASNASWNEGALSVPTQFWSYQARYFEQMWGGLKGSGKLSRMEAVRALAATSFMYGLPVGAGSLTFAFPMYESIKKAAMERNINLSDGWLYAATEGFMSYLTYLATGNKYAIGQKWGPGGFDQIGQILRGDKSFMDSILGVSGNLFKNMAVSTMPIFQAGYAAFTGKTEQFPLAHQDLLDVLKNVPAINHASTALLALTTGMRYTRNDQAIGPAKGMDALLLALGIDPLHVSDAFIGGKLEKDIKEGKAGLEKYIMRQYKNALDLMAKGDQEGGDKLLARVPHLIQGGRFTWPEQQRMWERALKDNQDMMTRVQQQRQQRQLQTPLSK